MQKREQLKLANQFLIHFVKKKFENFLKNMQRFKIKFPLKNYKIDNYAYNKSWFR